MPKRLHLPEVTLFVTAGPDLQLTFESFKRCLDTVQFGDAIFFSEGNPEQTKNWFRSNSKVIYIEKTGSAQASGIHYFRALPSLMKTTHMLTCDWDAGIADPVCWTPEFMEYDYVGARWPWMPDGKSIGNSGFCLISKRMMEEVATYDLRPDGCMDADIGQRWRPQLEAAGMKFPSEALADKFSYERIVPAEPSFGYHGFFNMHRHMDDAAMQDLLTKLSDHSVKGQHFLEMMLTYMALRKFPLVFAFYRKLRIIQSEETILLRLQGICNDPQAKDFLMRMTTLAETRMEQ